MGVLNGKEVLIFQRSDGGHISEEKHQVLCVPTHEFIKSNSILPQQIIRTIYIRMWVTRINTTREEYELIVNSLSSFCIRFASDLNTPT